jgi:pantothenate kinase-related protein Tda10
MRDLTDLWSRLAREAPAVSRDPERPSVIPPDTWTELVDRVVRPCVAILRGVEPTVVGVAGPPGSGKTTFARAVAVALGPRAVQASMDDFYLSRAERDAKGLRFRGGPGSHDLASLVGVLDDVRAQRSPVTMPRYDTHADDRAEPRRLERAPRPLILDGYFLGYAGDGYADVLERLDVLVFLDVDIETARSRRFDRERVLRDEGGGLSEPDMEAFWDEVLEPGVQQLVPGARANADLILSIDDEQRVTRVEAAGRAADVLRALSGRDAP